MNSAFGQPLDRSSPPPPGPIRPFHLSPVQADVLDNGLRLRSMARGKVPLLSACLVLDAGEVGVEPGREGIGVLTGDAIQGGTRRRTGVELAEALEGLGASLWVSTGWDATTVRFTCVAERMDEMVSLLAEVVREPAFPADEVERMRRQRLAVIHQRRMEPDQLANDELDRDVFPAAHPYHRPLAGLEESVGSLDEEAARTFAEERYGPARGGFVVVGDIAPDRVVELAGGHFGSWTGPEAPRRGAAPGSLEVGTRESVSVVHRPGAVQSEIRIGQPAPPRGHEDEMPLRVANTVLGGAFTSRLNLSLRERHGFTYGAHSRFAFRRDGGVFRMATAVQTEVTAQALAEMMSVLEDFAEGGPDGDELERARDYLAGIFPLRMETTAQLAERLAELVIFELPDDYHHVYRDRVREVDVDTARSAVRRHLHPEGCAIVVVGNADQVVPEVEALGIGAVTVREP